MNPECIRKTWDSINEVQLQFRVPGVHHIIYSVDGFLMLATGENGFSLLNPLTHELVTVVSPISNWDRVGFARLGDTYKIVFVGDSYCAINQLGTDQWKYKSFDNTRFSYDKFNTCLLDKRQYWVGHDTSKKDAIILVFDFESEEFSTISPPPLINYPDGVSIPECSQISEQDGKITICGELSRGILQVWVREELDKNEWTKVATLAMYSRLGHDNEEHNYRLIKIFGEKDEGQRDSDCLLLIRRPDVFHFLTDLPYVWVLRYPFDKKLDWDSFLHPALHSFSMNRLFDMPKKERDSGKGCE
ncbi:uncharacterized protein LOC125203360 [Salvia hispanica]|uniref:uncharacterized protein LOC125203360 n=1 Tax=Salvia hispanica TaxID=49212 RepID=UPI002009C7B2|nr:uncharacterized protein LOC125203360 [Salvia hispanica]